MGLVCQSAGEPAAAPSTSAAATSAPVPSCAAPRGARAWTPEQWASIVWHAGAVRHPQPSRVLGLTARGSVRHSLRRLRELALQTEIAGVPHV